MVDPMVRARAQARAATVDACPDRVFRYLSEPGYAAEVDALVDGFLSAVYSLDRRPIGHR